MTQFLRLVFFSVVLTMISNWFLSQVELLHLFVYSLNIVSLLQLIKELGRKLVFMEFISLSAITFWLTVPLLIFDFNIDRYAIPNLFGSDILAVDKVFYFRWAIPATLALIFGLSLNEISNLKLSMAISRLEEHLRSTPKNIPLVLFIIGAFSISVGDFMPRALGFIVFMLSQLTFISVLYCLFGSYQYSKWIYLGTGLITLKGVASGGMFGEIFWWAIIIGVYMVIKLKWGFVKKVIIIVFGLVCINVLQTVKGEYRKLTWQKSQKSEQPGLALLSKTVLKSGQESSEVQSIAFRYLLMYRMNHAYIVSRIMEHVPSKEPYANGETVFGSIVASFIPRFLWPDKPKSGGHDNIERFANFNPHGGASYDIGQIGDAWANYGFAGGIIFLFLYGLLNSWILKVLLNISRTRAPTLILWAPIIFLQLLKVEVSVVTNFNAAIKGAAFIILVYYISKALGAKI